METNAALKKLRLPATKNIMKGNAPAEFTQLIKGIAYDTGSSSAKSVQHDFVAIFSVTKTELEPLI